MWLDILNKVFLFLFILSILNVIRNSFFVIRHFKDKTRFILEKKPLILLGVSIAYIISSLITGINI